MTMKTTIPPHDWQLLSDYLDNQLSPGKRTRLEARLQTNPELRAALDDLRRNQTLLRNLPRMKAPRSFKLTPKMVEVRPASRYFPVFQFASALASLLLVMALVGDFLNVLPAGQEPALQAYGATAVSETAGGAEVFMEKESEEAPPSIAAQAPSLDSMAEETATAVAAVEDQSAPEEAPEAAMRAAATPGAADEAFSTLVGEEPQPSRNLTGWQWTEILLGIVALLTGLIAFTLRSRGA